MHDEQEQFLSVIERLYSSVLDDSQWLEALRGLTRFAGGHAAFHLASDPLHCEVLSSACVGVDPEAAELLLGIYADKEIRMPPALKYEVGQVVVDRGLLDWRTFTRSEIYNELCVPFDVPHLMAVWLHKSSSRFVSLSLEASCRHGPFTSQEIERFEKVVPYLMRSAQMRELMHRARLAQKVNHQVLEALPFGVVLLDAAGSILEMTSLAHRLVAQRALLTCAGKLHAPRPEDDRKLRGVVAMALRWREATNPPPDPVRLRRANGQPLVAVAVPLTRAHDGLLVMEPACVLMLIDPEQKIAACAKLIQKGFGLSTAEARLAARLFIGESLAEASRELHLSYNTCKTQLKSIFDKTDCASQTALVKKLMLLALARGR